MEHWDLAAIEAPAHAPQILATTDDARAILIRLPAGEQLQEHEVHERAFLVVVAGDVELTTPGADERISGGPGTMFAFAPSERHEVTARTEARLLLLLAPWPGDGHPGAMSLEEKRSARERAAQRASS